MQKFIVAAVVALTMGNALPYATAAAEPKKSAETTGTSAKPDFRGFGSDVKKGATETGHTIANGSKRAGTAIADGVKNLVHGGKEKPQNKNAPSGEKPAGGRAGAH
jgi:hypothetical protein